MVNDRPSGTDSYRTTTCLMDERFMEIMCHHFRDGIKQDAGTIMMIRNGMEI